MIGDIKPVNIPITHENSREVDIFYIILGVRIESIRIERAITQEGLGQMVGLTRSSIANIEAGRQRILAHQIVCFAKALRTTPLKLLKGI